MDRLWRLHGQRPATPAHERLPPLATLIRDFELALVAPMKSLEDALVDAFIVPAKRERYKGHLADRRRRAKILDGLNHCSDFDPRYASEIPSKTDIVALLRSRGAPESCHVISDARELDGRTMRLQEAIDETEVHMQGTLIGCVPGRLAYYYGEGGEQRLLLERAPNKPKQTDVPSGRR